jgi:hypothetical protein
MISRTLCRCIPKEVVVMMTVEGVAVVEEEEEAIKAGTWS